MKTADPSIAQELALLRDNCHDTPIIVSGSMTNGTRFSGTLTRVLLPESITILDDEEEFKIPTWMIVSESFRHNFVRPRGEFVVA